MEFVGPFAILVLVLSPVLIPLVITVWHAVARSSSRIERSREAAHHRRVAGAATSDASRIDDGVGEAVFRFRDGKMTRYQQYTDTAQMRAVMGVATPPETLAGR
jgi:hypothetical protein